MVAELISISDATIKLTPPTVNPKLQRNHQMIRSCLRPLVLQVTDVRRDLAQHKESQDAHGRKASEQVQSIIVSWIAVVVAGIVGVSDYLRNHR